MAGLKVSKYPIANRNSNQIIGQKIRNYYLIKRCFDVFISFGALIVLSPLFFIVVVAIRFESKGRSIYVQERVGLNGEKFKMYKFRSMCENAHDQIEQLKELNKRDGPAFKIDDDPRVTKVGRFIRKTCIDELPQFFNVLKGEMSVVGPRPPLESEVEEYTQYEKKRLSVTPGLTCYWQIKRNEDTSFVQWVQMDLDYIKKQSVKTDVLIILSTFKMLILMKGDI